MIKVKLADIVNSSNGLSNILKKELPIKAAYWLSRLMSKLDSEIKQFNLNRDNLIKKYGKETEHGEIRVDPDDKVNFEKFQKEFNDLVDIEIEVDINKIPLSLFGDVNVSAMELFFLDKFVEE